MSRSAGQIVAASHLVIAKFLETGGDDPQRALFALIDILDNAKNVIEDDAVDMSEFDAAVNAIVGEAYQAADRALEGKVRAAATVAKPGDLRAPPLAKQMPKNGTP